MIDKWMDELTAKEEPLSELEQRRILNRVMEQVEQERKSMERDERTVVSTAKPRPPRRWKRSAAVACVVVMALSAGAFGATVMDGGLAELLGGNDRGKEIVSDMGTIFEDQSQSIDGYTVTLRQMIHDRNGCYVLFDVSQDDDAALEPGYYYFRDSKVGLPDITRSGWFMDQPEEHDGQSDTVTMVLHYDSSEKLSGKTLKLTLKDFAKYDEEGELITLGEGSWIFEIPVGREDNTQTFRLDQEVTFLRGDTEKTITVKTVYLSPMSVVMETSDNYQSTDMREIRLLLADGSEVEFRSGGYGSGGPQLFGSNTQVDALFQKVIDPKDIKEIWFNGTKLEI
ncbi:MAG: DUF4179 domain-containing protein [Firmicutes bacterium]|nr:DUF4179 domain-containing protein [Bacillota bacterium]